MKFYTLITGLAPIDLAFESAIRQTVKSTVIGVVDDSNKNEVDYQKDHMIWYRNGRHHKAKNIFETINDVLAPILHKEDVVCLLDGDDWYKDKYALEPVRSAYQSSNVWLTHGCYEKISGAPRSNNGQYRTNLPVRVDRWKGSHLKTFRAGLFKRIPRSALRDEKGNWLTVCSDMAIMFPMLEMAGIDRVRFIQKKIYCYNDKTGMNDHEINVQKQVSTERWLRKQRSFPRLEEL